MNIGNVFTIGLLVLMSTTATIANAQQTISTTTMEKEKLIMTEEWDKTFPKSDKVDHRKVTFVNRFGITLAADMYVPKNASGSLPAIAVSGPFGAVKEQASGLYAQTLAEQGYLTVAFDPSFTGESGGTPRYSSSMDINTEDFCAAVDFLSCLDNVDSERIGILGICGWGGIALNAAALDPRVKATVSVTLYNLTRVTQRGYFDTLDEAGRYEMKLGFAKQRTEEFRTGEIKTIGGLPAQTADDAPDFFKQYVAYYKSESRGYHPRSLNSNMGWNITTQLMRLNQDLWTAAAEIHSPVLIVHGEKAHSRYFGEEAFEKIMSGKYAANKRLLIVPGATHCDLYDGGEGNYIPWSEIFDFYKSSMNNDSSTPTSIDTAKCHTDDEVDELLSDWKKGEPNTAYARYFTGNSYLAPVTPVNLSADEQTGQAYINVTFEPGCRNNWHIHHGARQILICVAGSGWYQEWGKPAVALKAGDIVDIPEGVKHWHGARRDSWFQHLATHVVVTSASGEQSGNEWLEPVTDEDYNKL